MIDGTKMWEVDIAEMIADWLAMSEEKNSDPYEWAKKNINVRWKFTRRTNISINSSSLEKIRYTPSQESVY